MYALPFALGLVTGAYLVWALAEVWDAGVHRFSLGTRGAPADTAALTIVTAMVIGCWILALWAA